MHYKRIKTKDEKEEFFIYKPQYNKTKRKKIKKKTDKSSPFNKLSEIRF